MPCIERGKELTISWPEIDGGPAKVNGKEVEALVVGFVYNGKATHAVEGRINEAGGLLRCIWQCRGLPILEKFPKETCPCQKGGQPHGNHPNKGSAG